jgi:hypothetical protein
VTIDPITEYGSVSVRLSGEVQVPSDGDQTVVKGFQYSTDGVVWSAGSDGSSVIKPGHSLAVSAEFTDLEPETAYQVRLAVKVPEVYGSSSEYEVLSEIKEFATTAPVAHVAPKISNFQISAISPTSAHFAADIDPGGSGDIAYDTRWHYQCTPVCPGLETGRVPAGSPATVASQAENLDPNTTYEVSLFASNAFGEVQQVESFHTPPAAPLVKAWAAGPVGPTAADLNAQIDPRGSATAYWFEWGTVDCTTGPCASIPPDQQASAGAGQTYVYVIRHLTGLSPSTTYHFRVVAKNASGTTTGDDQTFTTAAPEAACANAGMPGTGSLPDCRAYELVSPPEKNGANVGSVTYRTHAAADGNATTFFSSGSFGDSIGTSVWVEYMARRDAAPGTNGWRTHAITPPLKPVTAFSFARGKLPAYEGEFSADLSHAVFVSQRPLTAAPNAAAATNLYLRSDLQSAGAGSYRLLTDSLAPTSSVSLFELLARGRPYLAGASSDFSHVIFESRLGLTEEGPSAPQVGKNKLYENAGGTVRIVGRVPVEPATSCDDSGPPAAQCVQAESSQAGISASAQEYSARMISADGSRIFFQTPSDDRAAGIDRDNGGGNIYLREGGARTFQINASETEPPAPPSPTARALLWDASRDGSRAFFTTDESLVEEDEDGGNSSLYMYEVNKPEGERLTLLSVDHEPSDGRALGVFAVIGASDDGHYLYFLASGQAVAGEPSEPNAGLYLWHDGQVSYIGHFGDSLDPGIDRPDSWWAFEGKYSRVTPDGRHLLFATALNEGFEGIGGFRGYEQGAGCSSGNVFACHRELYVYNADTGRLSCASCNPTGAPATSTVVLNHIGDGNGPVSSTSHLGHAFSDDGRYVFFSTEESLVPEDTNGTWDAYEYDTSTEEVHLISSGEDPKPSFFMDASANGHDVFFTTSERLNGWDTDTSADLYDARIGGGLPEPPPVPAACAGESCLPATAPTPRISPTASTATGPGNPKAGRCPRGKIRRHGRCVKKHHGKKHKRAGSKPGGGK